METLTFGWPSQPVMVVPDGMIMVKSGTSVIYITHRLAELRQIAQRVTVLRDGRYRGSSLVSAISDADLLGLIVGRTLGSTFPPKLKTAANEIGFSASGLNGKGFKGAGAYSKGMAYVPSCEAWLQRTPTTSHSRPWVRSPDTSSSTP